MVFDDEDENTYEFRGIGGLNVCSSCGTSEKFCASLALTVQVQIVFVPPLSVISAPDQKNG